MCERDGDSSQLVEPGKRWEHSELGASPTPHKLTKTLNKPPDEWCLWISAPLISVTITVWKIALRIWGAEGPLSWLNTRDVLCYKKKKILLRPFPAAKLCILLRCSNVIRIHYIENFSYVMFIKYPMRITIHIRITEWSEQEQGIVWRKTKWCQFGREHNVLQLSSPLQEKEKL